MVFGINRAQIIGRLGADVVVNHLASGGRVANLSIATDESYINRHTGEKVDKTEWHRVVTFQDGLIDMFERHAVKGRLALRRGQAADAALVEARRGRRPLLDRDPAGARRAGAVPRPAERQRRSAGVRRPGDAGCRRRGRQRRCRSRGFR